MALPALAFDIALTTGPLADPPVWNDVSSGYPNAVRADTPVAYWRLGESSGVTAYDETMSSVVAAELQDLTYVNSPTLGVAGPLASDSNTAVTFNVTGGIVASITDRAALKSFSAITLECWVNLDNLAINHAPFYKDDGAASYDYTLYVTSGTGRIGLDLKTTAGLISKSFTTATITAGAWYHIAGTFDGTNWRAYINGVLIETQVDAKTLSIAGTGNLHVGLIDGTLDEAAIYSSALSATRIGAHYHAGVAFYSNIEGGGYSAGRQIALGPAQPGELTIQLDDPSRWMEPGNTTAPYFEQVKRGRRCRLRIGSNPVWSGYLESINTAAGGGGVQQKALLTAVDGFKLLSRAVPDFTVTRDDFSLTTVSGLGTPPKGSAWTVLGGSWNVDGLGAAITAAGVSLVPEFHSVVTDMASADITMGVTLVDTVYNVGVSGGQCFVFRASDNNNLYYVNISVQSYVSLYKRVAGVNTQLATFVASSDNPVNPGDSFIVQVDGWSVRVLHNGNPILHKLIAGGDQFNGTTTTHGLGFASTGLLGAPQTFHFDNFFSFSADVAQQLSSARVNAILDNIGWPSGDRSVNTGTYQVQALLGDKPVDAGDRLYATITSGAATLTILGTRHTYGDTIQIDDEQMLVTNYSAGVSGSPDTLTVTRAVKGTAAAHTLGAVVYRVDIAAEPTLAQSALEYLQDAERAEGGLFYMAMAGQPVFESANTRSTASSSTTSQATFGNGAGAVGLIAWPQRSSEDTDTLNDVQVTREGGVLQQALDTAAIALDGRYSHSETTINITDVDALGRAKAILNHFREDYAEIRKLTCDMISTSVQALLISLSISDLVTLTWNPVQGGGGFTVYLFVEGYETRFEFASGRPSWTVTWQTSLRQRSTYWILGDSVAGVLGVTTILAP